VYLKVVIDKKINKRKQYTKILVELLQIKKKKKKKKKKYLNVKKKKKKKKKNSKRAQHPKK